MAARACRRVLKACSVLLGGARKAAPAVLWRIIWLLREGDMLLSRGGFERAEFGGWTLFPGIRLAFDIPRDGDAHVVCRVVTSVPASNEVSCGGWFKGRPIRLPERSPRQLGGRSRVRLHRAIR